MHYLRAVQFSEVISIFVRVHLRLVAAAFATFPPAGVQEATFLTSFLIHPSQLIEANLFVDLFLVVLHHWPVFPRALLVLWVFLHFTYGVRLVFTAGWQS